MSKVSHSSLFSIKIFSVKKSVACSALLNLDVFSFQTDDSDFQAKLAKLINTAGTQLIICWSK